MMEVFVECCVDIDYVLIEMLGFVLLKLFV